MNKDVYELEYDAIHNLDCLTGLKKLPDNSIKTCVTSPPYWSLRDYGKDNQLGNEDSPEDYIEKLVEIFREVRRVIKDDGTLWLNLGDVYNKQSHVFGYKPKELMGLPWRLAFALQSDGWYLRADIIWSKPNPMPESVKDRPTKSHEYVFLLTKNKNYYYDYESIMEEAIIKNKKTKKTRSSGKYGDIEVEKAHRQGIHADRGVNTIEVRSKLPEQKTLVDFLRNKTSSKILHEYSGISKSTIDHWFRYDKSGFSYPKVCDWEKVRDKLDDRSDLFKKIDEGITFTEFKTDEVKSVKDGFKNRRTVWQIATKPFRGGHFATFPEKLVEPCIMAGSSEGDIVLDPFMGAGTTALVSKKLNRRFIGFELNEEYVSIAEERIESSIGE